MLINVCSAPLGKNEFPIEIPWPKKNSLMNSLGQRMDLLMKSPEKKKEIPQ
jgi:hypothetical protein